MGVPFAAGQLALAAILWWHNERNEPFLAMERTR